MLEASYCAPHTGLDCLVRAISITGEISKFFGILHICRLYCFAIQFHSDGKCRTTLMFSQPPHLTRSKNHLLAGLSGVLVPAHRDDAAVLHQHLLEVIVDDLLQV